jgi:hypothetical protein
MAGDGFYRVGRIDGKWQVLDPDGTPVILAGLNHYCNGKYMPWNLEERYGSREAWRRSVRDRHREWGFTYMPTSVGPAVRPSERGGFMEEGNDEWAAAEYAEMDYPFTAMLEVPRRYMASSRDYPDVFSKDFRDMVDARCREFVRPLADNPHLVGWHLCHNPPWHDRAPGFDNWLEACVGGADGRAVWIDLMRGTYGDPDAYRETYGPAIDSFDEIGEMARPLFSYVSTDRGLRDRLAYMRKICDEWYKVFAGTVRKYDPNHLLLGDRNTTHLFPMAGWSLEVMSSYIDVLSINVMGTPEVILEVMAPATSGWAGPIHLADTGVGVRSEGPSTGGFVCRNADEFARVYAGILDLCESHPQIVGFGWCGYYNIPGRRKGVVDVATDEPIRELVGAMSERNRRSRS